MSNVDSLQFQALFEADAMLTDFRVYVAQSVKSAKTVLSGESFGNWT